MGLSPCALTQDREGGSHGHSQPPAPTLGRPRAPSGGSPPATCGRLGRHPGRSEEPQDERRRCRGLL